MKNSKIINKKKGKPFFSIITVVKNDEINIKKTIKSIINQTFKDFEYIIIDGKSSDTTLNKIFHFKKKINTIISEKDRGIYYAMNKGALNGKVILYKFRRFINKKCAKDYKKIMITKILVLFLNCKKTLSTGVIYKHGINFKNFNNFDFATSHSTVFYKKNFLKIVIL